jgi:succinyl-CoA synthetase beta subunit
LFFEKDCLLLEINPLAETAEKGLCALDAKIELDDNALFRHPDCAAMRDPGQETSEEVRSAGYGLRYIPLEGTVGCLVNGAGLAMATMDLLYKYGGTPANFLDVGGGASAEQIRAAFELMFESSRVRSVFVNIFGGIVCCDLIAQGLLSAVERERPCVPLVVRLEGTRAAEGRELLRNSAVKPIVARSLAGGAKSAIDAAKGKTSR